MKFHVMKASFLILIVLVMFFISSCQKEKETEKLANSSLVAQKNSSNWVSTDTWGSYSEAEQKFYLNALKRHPKNDQEEELSISFVMKDLKSPMVTSDFSSEWVRVAGGSSVADGYHIDPSAENNIEIFAVDTQKKIITGKFSIQLVRDSKFSDKGETLTFQSGYFSVSYAEVDDDKSQQKFLRQL
jgi:hypothetical protein